MLLYCLAYISDRVIATDGTSDQDFLDWELEAILASAHRHNEDSDITGALLSTPTQFVQYLEGSQTSVRECFDRLSNDTRHTNIKTLFYKPLNERFFAEWSMAACDESAVDHAILAAAVEVAPGSPEAHQLGEQLVTELRKAVALG